jgi:nucleoside triphosphate pyrophosphatase
VVNTPRRDFILQGIMDGSPHIYLASTSPRRLALLAQIGVSFTLLHARVDEAQLPGESADEYVRRLALEKARAGRSLLAARNERPVLGADTAVVADGRILGKPRNREDALDMLQVLSGRSHLVLSAVALAAGREAVRVSTSSVTFRTVTRAQCAAYWETGEPRDKAGGYAIQGRAAVFVSRLEGSYSGVMGLPVYETAELLQEFGIGVLPVRSGKAATAGGTDNLARGE